jgi:hypothetical protein
LHVQVVEVSARYDDVCLGSAFVTATNAQRDAALLQVPDLMIIKLVQRM